MLDRLFQKQELNISEKEFIEKLSQYIRGNCEAVYNVEYIPRLVQNICHSQNIKLELHKGFLYIYQNNIKYKIPYAFNMYKGYIIDLNLFVVKCFYKKKLNEYNNQFQELPPYLISNFKYNNNQLDGIDNIVYESKELILRGDFQPTKIIEDDTLLLAIYNNCYAYKISLEVLEYNKFDVKNMEIPLKLISWVDLEELK